MSLSPKPVIYFRSDIKKISKNFSLPEQYMFNVRLILMFTVTTGLECSHAPQNKFLWEYSCTHKKTEVKLGGTNKHYIFYVIWKSEAKASPYQLCRRKATNAINTSSPLKASPLEFPPSPSNFRACLPSSVRPWRPASSGGPVHIV